MNRQQYQLQQDHISVYKRRLLNYLDSSQRIVELCGGKFGESQAYKKFFPYEMIPNVIEDTTCQVAFDVSSTFSLTNRTFILLSVYFFIVCHVDIARMPNDVGLRYDLIAQELTKDLAYNDTIGLGPLQVAYTRPYQDQMTPTLIGRQLQFDTFDVSPEAYARHS